MEEKLYIVVEECWEYNDEYYFQPEDESYTIHEERLMTESEAIKLRDELNAKCTLETYDYDTDEDVKIQPFKVIKLKL